MGKNCWFAFRAGRRRSDLVCYYCGDTGRRVRDDMVPILRRVAARVGITDDVQF